MSKSKGKGRLRYELEGSDPLPPIDGPKLKPFPDRGQDIELIEVLSTIPEEAQSESVGHGHVFKVRIHEKLYALKVFKFFDLKTSRGRTFPYANWRIDDETFTYQTDPFFAECRAYGRIQAIQEERFRELHKKQRNAGKPPEIKPGQKQQAKKRRRRPDHWQPPRKKAQKQKPQQQEDRASLVPAVAALCYGYIGLPSRTYEEVFRSKFGIEDWNRTESDQARPIADREPFRALVKEFIDDLQVVRRPAKMLSDLRLLRENGVYQRDIYARNYVGGLLVDFSIAWTRPHWVLETLQEPNLENRKAQELFQFNRLMEEAGESRRAIKEHTRWLKSHN